MGLAYTVKDPCGQYFITCTVHQWADVFTRREYIDILLDSIKYCQKAKGLKVYAWVIMTNHIHLIIQSDKGNLSGIIRDFKKFTATRIFEAIDANPKESRERWLLWLLRKDERIWFWEEGYHGEGITTREFYDSKVNYIHLNPVRAGLVEKEEEYVYSSCGDFYGTRKGLLGLEI